MMTHNAKLAILMATMKEKITQWIALIFAGNFAPFLESFKSI